MSGGVGDATSGGAGSGGAGSGGSGSGGSGSNGSGQVPVRMWTDGACKGNPGRGGWGVLMKYGTHSKEIFGGERETTNNRMELTAVIRGLQALTRPSRVELHVDSQYVMKGMTEWIHGWKRNGWRTAAKKPVANAELWRELDELITRHDVTWTWVRGHAGDPGNERADELANRGVEELAE